MLTRTGILITLVVITTILPAGAEPKAPDTAGFLPKGALGVSDYLAEHPECDGRGVLVAVLDTGVDLLHPALRTTSEGKPKVIDFYDATDAGDVDTTIKAMVAEGSVTGLSGRRLRLAEGVTGEVRLGLVRSGDVYPRRLLRRLRGERKRKREEALRLAADRAPSGKAPKAPPGPGDPVHDLVLYRSGDSWRVVVDLEGDGDLSGDPVLSEYPVAREVAELGRQTRLGFGVKILRGGDAVSLLFDGGGHGTHVAGIITGFYGEGSPLNGLAPGAQVLAVKVGNGRYGGPTTHLSIMRGLEWAGRMGADVVNISFGGHTLYGDAREESARFVTDAVKKYGYAVCLSAGNNGPGHVTVGSPATSRRALTIGAWCPESTQTTNYGVIQPTGGSLFGFSSRGPLPGGRTGVDFIAPGAAVSTMPEWTLQAGQNMNGTSMAAPQAAGAVAVILSAAKRETLDITATRLVTALRRGAKPMAGLTAVEQGYGLIQVAGSVDALREMTGAPEPVDWEVKTDLPVGVGGGIFDPAYVTNDPRRYDLTLVPVFRKTDPTERKSRFGRMLGLRSDAAWLTVASPVHANSRGATVRVDVDPAKLKPGVNVAQIRAVDLSTGLEATRITATVVRPHVPPGCDEWIRESFRLVPGETKSLFFVVPPAATQVRIEARETAERGESRIAFRIVDPRSGVRGQAEEFEPGEVSVLHRGVRAGTTLEVVASRPFRTAPEESQVEIRACFRGLATDVRELAIPRGRIASHLNLHAGGDVRGRFEAFVEWREEPLTFRWESSRDTNAPLLLGRESVFVHKATADFDVQKDRAEIRFELRYESPFEDYFDDTTYLIRDGNGKILKKGMIRFGAFQWKPPLRGRFELVLHTWERGRRFHRDGRLFAPVLMRKIRRENLAVKHDIYEGLVPGGASGATFDLPDGTLASAFVVRSKASGTLRGRIRFKDSEWNVSLLDLPLTVHAADPVDRVGAWKSKIGEMARAEVQAALDLDRVAVKQAKRLVDVMDLAYAAGEARSIEDAALLVISARKSPAQASELLASLDDDLKTVSAKDTNGRQAFLRARVELALMAGDVETAKKAMGGLKGDSEGNHLARFLVAQATDDAKGALAHLDRHLKTAPARPTLTRGRIQLLQTLGRTADARRELLSWTERFPQRRGDVPSLAAILEEGK